MRVYKYLEARWAIKDLEKRRLKISQMDDLNDPFELLNCEMSNEDSQKKMDKVMKKLSLNDGVICFSKNSSDPLLWGHYADKHKGVCLGFDISAADEVIYITNKKSLCAEFEKALSLSDFKTQEKIMRSFFITKYIGWKYEDEVRVFPNLDEKDEDGLYYIDISKDPILRQVLLGVRCDKANIDMVLKNVPKHVEVIQTRLDFETFKVVENYKLK